MRVPPFLRLSLLAATLLAATAALGDVCIPVRSALTSHLARHIPVVKRHGARHVRRSTICAPTALPVLAPVTVTQVVSLDELVADAGTQTSVLLDVPTGNPYDVDYMPWWWIVVPSIPGPHRRCRWHIRCAPPRHSTAPEPEPLALLMIGLGLVVARRWQEMMR